MNYAELSLDSLRVLKSTLPPFVSEEKVKALEMAIKEKEQKQAAFRWATINNSIINLN